MNVTGIEWRGQDPNDGRFARRARPRPKPADTELEEEDVIDLHGEDSEESADGIDEVAS